MIRRAKATEISRLLEITQACATHMIAEGILQWNEHYPSRRAFGNDVDRDELYVYEKGNEIVGCIVISTFKDEEYQSVSWLTKDSTHYYIHRLAVHPEFQSQGIAQELMNYAEAKARQANITSIRLDTFSQNTRNNRFYEQRGYKRLGNIYFPKQSIHPFHCYELVLKELCEVPANKISFKNINRLAIPALLTGIAEPILSITDAAVVGNIELNATEALAAVGIVGSFLSALIWILGQTRSALQAIIARYYGANQLEEVSTLPAQAIYFNILLSFLILGGTVFFIEGIFSLYNASGLILDYCIDYYSIRVWGFPLTLFTFAVFGIFRGLQNTFWPMVVALIGAAVNIILDFLLVYGVTDMVPALGLEGAAYASLIAQAVMAILVLVLLLKKTNISLKLKFPIHPELYTLIGMALNLFVRTIALNVALYLANAFATDYGKNFIAAQTILINIWLFSAFFIDGYASAGNILSGRLLGEKDYEGLLKLAKKVSLYGFIVGLVLMAAGWFLYTPLGLLFSKEPMVIQRYQEVFWIVACMQPLNAVAFIFDGIFKGLGKMKQLRNVLLISTFVGFVPTLFIMDYFNYQLHAIWAAFVVWMLFRAGVLIILFRRQFAPKVSEKPVKAY